MKKSALLTVLFGVCLVFVLVASAPAQVIKLTLADQNAEVAWGPVHALQPWVKKVEEATKNRVKIDIFPAQTLAKGPDMTPLSDVITLPSLPIKNAEKASEVLWKLYEKFPSIRNEYKDVHVVTLWASSPYFLITTKKQVKTMEDIKGMKIRVVGGPPTDQMKALGAVPTLIPMPDTYLALDKGVIDGMGAAWEPILGFRLYEIAKYYTIVPLSAVYFSMSMNKQKWESLPKDIQDAITSAGGLEAAKFWGRNFYDTAEKGVLELAKKGNYQINRYVVPQEEVARWTKVAGEPIWKEWVKKMEGKGHREAQQILNTTLDLLK
jgi:TRAP-type C4-dicarboxylate transport system substrate-binding protein